MLPLSTPISVMVKVCAAASAADANTNATHVPVIVLFNKPTSSVEVAQYATGKSDAQTR
jgi:hypothetical protein